MNLSKTTLLFSLAALFLWGSPQSFCEDFEKDAAPAEQEESDESDATPIPHQLRFNEAFAKINKQERKLDPFGTPMNQEVARKQPSIIEEEDATEPQKAGDSIDAALKKLNITGIMPGSGTVLIRGRSLKVGQILAIWHENVLFRLRLSGVHRDGLEFADTESDKIVTLPLNILPLAMMKQHPDSSRRLPTGAQLLSTDMVIP